MPTNLSQFSSTAENLGLSGRTGAAVDAVASSIDSLKKFGGAVSKTLQTGAEVKDSSATVDAKVQNTLIDWRVSLSIPPGSYQTSKVLSPITRINKFVFPYTPSIQLSHQANYSAMDPVHGNYSFMSYEHSKIDKITISGDFYCEDAVEAQYWIAAVHYLRSVTKMYFGTASENAGAPPPVVKLNGYGDFVFNNVPVVVTNFQIELPKDVDYIPSKFALSQADTDGGAEGEMTTGSGYAPVRSTIVVTLQPVYSRSSIRNFNLQDFVNGNYINNTDGMGGFI